MSHNDRCAWLRGESCDCGPRGRDTSPEAAEVASLRRDLAVARAALSEAQEKIREVCCDLGNDAHCFDLGTIDDRVVKARLAGYAHDLADFAGFKGPVSLTKVEAHHTALDGERAVHGAMRAAVAQCATALREARINVWMSPDATPETALGPELAALVETHNAKIDRALANPDVERAVRVEAAREAEVVVLRELADAGLKLRHELLDRYGWINWSACVPGAGLCICHEVNDLPLPDEPTAADIPVEHDSLCASWRAALDAWQGPRDRLAALDALTSERRR